MTFVRRTAVGLASVCALGAAALVAGPIATAEEGQLHHVRYTVSSDAPWNADIYFREVDPPDWGVYSHDPYVFTPKVEAQVGPGQTWVRDVMLADPQQWALVIPTSGQAPVTPYFHCTLEVDGAVVKTNTGPKGALCSIRNW